MSYTLPSVATTKMAYPVVAGVDEAVLQFWLDRAVGKDVDQSWPEYGADAQMAAAVHRYLRAQASAGSSSETGDLAGVTQFKSSSFQVEFAASYVEAQAAGGWSSTEAGRDYYELLQRYAGGPSVTTAGVAPCGYGFSGWAGLPGCLP